MPNNRPTHCPYCGTALTPVEPPLAHRCESCDDYVFHNPTPAARVAVLDGDAVLLAKAGGTDRDLWGTPGGMVEPHEHPHEAAARELREETNLSVDPDALELFDARTFVKFEDFDKLSISYAVARADTTGSLAVGEEPRDVRFWTPAELEASDAMLLDSWPDAHRDLEWWVSNARAALEGSR